HKVMYLDESCCTYHQEPSISAISSDGNIYSCGNFRMGARPDGGSDYMIRNYEEKNATDKPYESYISSIGNDGKLKWIKYTGYGTLISSVYANKDMVVVGGKLNRQKKFIGNKVDTTEKKIAFLASLNPKGKLLWVQTFNATTVNSISIDHRGFIYASFDSNRSTYDIPLKIGSDTISNTFKRVVVASFDKNGKYRWFKMSNAMMSQPSNTKLYNDECGNLMITGEMWYSLKVNMSLFDAAIVKGEGYGGAPLAAKIRTTIPDELLVINDSLVSLVNSNNITSDNNPTCIPIPFPWKLELFPNPTSGLFTLRVTTSYADNKVSIELWDSKGKFLNRIMEPQQKEAGVFTLNYDISDLANGIYIVVLRGSRIATTERIVLNK
ncbi:MAG: T9SS type A sorting domain-containing protein, partial [Bacteroidales bacterium]|nr:T9SS type A sorting domain-containing protein [Bacteroidales bacterium]